MSDEDPLRHAERIHALLELRGFHKACDGCPGRMPCVSGACAVGYLCLKCLKIYMPSIGVLLSCDVMTPSSVAATGACPICDNGLPLSSFVEYEGARLEEEKKER